MKYHNNLQRKLKKILDVPVKVISVVVVGALGTTPIKLKQLLSDIGIDTENSRIAEKHRLIFCKDPPKCSWGLRSLVVTESQEIESLI